MMPGSKSTPDDRQGLIEAISFELWGIVGSESKKTVLRYIQAMEALGVRPVPAQPTKKMIDAGENYVDLSEMDEAIADAIAASPFAPEVPS